MKKKGNPKARKRRDWGERYEQGPGDLSAKLSRKERPSESTFGHGGRGESKYPSVVQKNGTTTDAREIGLAPLMDRKSPGGKRSRNLKRKSDCNAGGQEQR